MKKEFKLESKNNGVNEITANGLNFKTLASVVNAEKIIFVKDKMTNLLKRHESFTSKTKAKAEQKKLDKEGIQNIMINKSKTANQYEGAFLFEDEEGNAVIEIGLDNTIKRLNQIHKKDMHLRKQRDHKETIGFVAFAYNEKTNSWVCTRLYDDREKALSLIYRRANVSKNTIMCVRVVRYYKGFEFKHQDLDDCHKMKDAKAKLRNIK